MDEQRKRMTAKRKLEVYLETRQKDANVLCRQHSRGTTGKRGVF